MLRALLLFLFLSASAQPEQPGAAEQERLQAIAERGRLLFEIDRAAWVTTDDLRDRLRGREVEVRGWVVERDADDPKGWVVTYYTAPKGGSAEALYRGRVRDEKVVSGEVFEEGRRPSLTPAQLRLRQAVETARRVKKYRPCTPAPFNAAAIPPAGEADPIDVYLLTAAVENDIYPFGGHFLVRVSPQGRVLSRRKFTNSCLNLTTRLDRGDEELAALGVTHVLDPTPTEIHVFLSIWSGYPVAVGTKAGVWMVGGTQIEKLAND
jgi:hypothetical protein